MLAEQNDILSAPEKPKDAEKKTPQTPFKEDEKTSSFTATKDTSSEVKKDEVPDWLKGNFAADVSQEKKQDIAKQEDQKTSPEVKTNTDEKKNSEKASFA